jgi:SAM-dependent methyltransferase
MTEARLVTLNFGIGGNARPYLGAGWSHDEGAIVWAIGPESQLSIARPTDLTSYLMELRLWPYICPPKIAAQRLTIEVNGHELGSHILVGSSVVRSTIPESIVTASDRLNIVFRHPDGAKPSDLVRHSTDNRPLALAFQQCSLFGAELPPFDSDYLVPPPELLFDGSVTTQQFKESGEGFAQVNLITRAQLLPNGRVLDIGSGNGQKARVLAYHLDRAGSYEGLDVVRKGVEWCQQRYAKFPNFRFQVADLYSSHYNPEGRYRDADYRLPFPDADFDLVFLCSVFTHMLPDGVSNYISEIGRVLRPGGRCVSTFFLLNHDSLSRVQAGDSSLDFTPELGLARVVDPKNPSKAVAFSEDWVREKFAGAGLRVVETAYGTWCGGKDILGAYQDTLLSLKE